MQKRERRFPVPQNDLATCKEHIRMCLYKSEDEIHPARELHTHGNGCCHCCICEGWAGFWLLQGEAEIQPARAMHAQCRSLLAAE